MAKDNGTPPTNENGIPAPGSLWSVVLAGGEGSRLRPLVRQIHADGRPKQFAVIVGSRSLLRHTLDRSALLVPPWRTVVCATRPHAAFLPTDLAGPGTPRVLVQPSNCGTAAGVLLPAHWILRRDAQATVVVFPSDHFIADDAVFMARVAELVAAAGRHPDRIFLLGAEPDSAESGYGWIEPGEDFGRGMRRVARFLEKPGPEEAEACLRRGGLWNTFVLASSAAGLVEAGRQATPDLHERLAGIRAYWGTPGESSALDRAYQLAPSLDFCRDVLSGRPSALAVGSLPKWSWSDWGTPDRVVRTLRRKGLAPGWLDHLAPTA
jgi:mannose-1-phosphate guanylyltransferase